MYRGKKVCVSIIAYNEEQSIKTVIEGFKKMREIDRIIVVNNNSRDKTAENARKAGAAVVDETRQGYGYACQRALKEGAKHGDIVVLTEGDASFEAQDVEKFFAYIHDADMVIGTRTTRELIGEGAKMDWFLLWGNLFLAKLIQLRFFGRVRLTDVGCTFRAVRKDKIIIPNDIGGSHFSPAMIIDSLKKNVKVVEIPVNYMERVGQSKITSDRWKSFKLGLKMLKLIVTR
jgi:glycosyltransferase involved in cell wall biosynthesis